MGGGVLRLRWSRDGARRSGAGHRRPCPVTTSGGLTDRVWESREFCEGTAQRLRWTCVGPVFVDVVWIRSATSTSLPGTLRRLERLMARVIERGNAAVEGLPAEGEWIS